MAIEKTRPTFAVGLIERHDRALLIALLPTPPNERRHWTFPRGRVEPGESPEAAMRRIARDYHHLEIEIVVGQPPVVETIDAEEIELRYMFCGIIAGQPQPGPYEEVRWALRPQLREYDFEPATRPVVDWLLER